MFSRGMPTASDKSPRRLSDISPQLQQLTSLVVENNNKEALKASRSMADINSTSIEERILRITGYYGFSGKNSLYCSTPIPDTKTNGKVYRVCRYFPWYDISPWVS